MPSPHIAATALIDGAAVSPLSLRRGYRSNKSSEGSSSNEGSREASREASRRPSVPAAEVVHTRHSRASSLDIRGRTMARRHGRVNMPIDRYTVPVL